MKTFLKKMFKRFGFEVIKSRVHVEDVLIMFNFDVVFDVGANIGQFAEYIRSQGYNGRIVSFEPVKEAYEKLKSKAMREDKWTAVNIGLGRNEVDGTINVARSTVYSSLLKPLSAVKEFAGDAIETSAHEQVTLRTLDSQYPIYVHGDDKVFLKIDTQGFEKEVLLGGTVSLNAIKGVQVELSLSPMYDGEAPLAEIVSFLEAHGYKMVLIDPVTYDRQKGNLLQVDCVFLKNDFGPFSANHHIGK
ncbi:MAG: FkbM family methyltransferase [Candidatus Kryptoniota bacterium]